MRSILHQYAPAGRPWLILGAIALAVDAWLSWQYGWAQSYGHAAGFALLAIVWCMLPDQTYAAFRRREWGLAALLLAACIPVGVMSAQSHLGYGSSVRLGDMQQTGAQNAKHEDARRTVRDNEALLVTLTAARGQLVKEQPWAVTISADGLRAQIGAADEAIRQEERRGGCGPKCLALKRDKAGLEERIATIEKATDYARRIESTNKAIAEARQAAGTVEYRSSAVVNINRTAAQIALVAKGASPEEAIAPSDTTQQWVNILLAAGNTLAFLVMAPVCLLVAGRYRLPAAEDVPARRGPIDEKPDVIIATPPPAPRPVPPQIRTITVADTLRQMARAA
jgi:hypothetical protein